MILICQEGTELKFDLVVVDESSMLDINIAYSLLKALQSSNQTSFGRG